MRKNLFPGVAFTGAMVVLLFACGDPQPAAPTGSGVPVQAPSAQPMGQLAVQPGSVPSPVAQPEVQPVAPAALPSPQAAAPVRYWVWLREKAPGVEKTYELVETAGSFSQVAARDGIRIWLDGAPADISRTAHKMKRCLCDPETQKTVCAPGETNTFYSTQLVTTGKTVPLSKPPKDAASMEDASHSVVLMASLGPYMAVEESFSETGGCTAHGTYHTELAWYDLRTGATVDMLKTYPPPKRIRKQLDKKLCAKVLACDPESGSAQEDCETQLVGLEPLWAAGGIVRRYVGSAPVPYTCSGDDSAYAVSARFGALPFTGELVQVAKVPPLMEPVLKKLAPGGSLGGVYKLPPEAPALSR